MPSTCDDQMTMQYLPPPWAQVVYEIRVCAGRAFPCFSKGILAGRDGDLERTTVCLISAHYTRNTTTHNTLIQYPSQNSLYQASQPPSKGKLQQDSQRMVRPGSALLPHKHNTSIYLAPAFCEHVYSSGRGPQRLGPGPAGAAEHRQHRPIPG